MIKNRVVNNAAWIVGCRIVQSLLNLIVGMLTARFLGPGNYGLISYVGSIVGFFIPLMKLGLNATLVQEITDDEKNEGKVLGTALGLNIPSGIISIAVAIGFVFFANKGERETLAVCAIYSVSLLFQAAEMITFWYQAKLLSKYPSIAMVIGYIAVSVYKIFLLVSQKSVLWFAASNALDHLVISTILIVSYIIIGKQRLSFSFAYAKRMLSKSKYYIVSAMMITIFQQTDKLMLKNMIGDEATGFYAAAVTCAGIFGFVYAAIIDSSLPEILQNKKISTEKYENSISCVYSIVFYASLVQSLATTILAKPMILIMYGEEYMPAVSALRIISWFVTYSYFGCIRNAWILAEGKHKYVVWIDVIGASVNVILNAILIPVLDIVGAAVASLMTQFFMNLILGFIMKPLRKNNELMMRGMNPKFAIEQAKIVLSKLGVIKT